MNETLSAYLAFLWEQFQYDWGWLSNPWLFVVGNILYLIFFTVKWTVLLAPITIPCMVLRCGWQRPVYVVVRDDRRSKDPTAKIYNN